MKFEYRIGSTLAIFLSIISCQNYIIERAGSEFFPLSEGNWWLYSDGSLYDPHTLLVEVEPKDTLLQMECYPVSYSGEVKYYMESNKGINEYVKIVYNFSGTDYTIVEGFLPKIELPLVEGNTYRDSLFNSVELFSDSVKARFVVNGLVSKYEYDELYGSVYKVILTFEETIILADTAIVTTESIDEYYAPGIGLVRFRNAEGFYQLIEYNVQ